MANAIGPAFVGGLQTFVMNDEQGYEYTITFLPDRANDDLRFTLAIDLTSQDKARRDTPIRLCSTDIGSVSAVAIIDEHQAIGRSHRGTKRYQDNSMMM